jgi:hypothetical protein
MIGRAVLGSLGLTLALAPSAQADACPASTVDVADWPLARSARVPGFTIRLPRTFRRDSTATSSDSMPSARWSDAARGRLTLSRRTGAVPTAVPSAEGRTNFTTCEDRVGSATATIVSYGEGAVPCVIHARIQWPDGEALEVHAEAADRVHLDQLLAALRTIRRSGA